MSDQVNHPKHYNSGKIEVIEFLEDQKLEPHEWNCVKYVCRAKHKGKRIEDLEKAIWYLRRKIEILKAEEEKREPVRPNDMSHREYLQKFQRETLHEALIDTLKTPLCANCGHQQKYHDFPPDEPIIPGSLIRCVNGCRCRKFKEVG